MEKFTNVTLRDIDKLMAILRDILSDDSKPNADLVGLRRKEFEEIEGFITVFFDSIDPDQYYRFTDSYRSLKRSGISVYSVFGDHTVLLLDLLIAYRAEYIENAKQRLFELPVSQMTGRDLNEYLILIGLLK